MRKFIAIHMRKVLKFCGFGDTLIATEQVWNECQDENKLHECSNFVCSCKWIVYTNSAILPNMVWDEARNTDLI